jgi:hypothetical protein
VHRGQAPGYHAQTLPAADLVAFRREYLVPECARISYRKVSTW